MAESGLPTHWDFAAAQAFARLRELVHGFDFLKLNNGHTYVGVEPSLLINVIDGFLSEPEGTLLGGDRAELIRHRQLLVDRIRPAHEQGLVEGRRRWHEGERVYGGMTIEELHQLALRLAPNDDMVKGWYAEGFCFSYSFEEMYSLRDEAGA